MLTSSHIFFHFPLTIWMHGNYIAYNNFIHLSNQVHIEPIDIDIYGNYRQRYIIM